MINYKSHVPKLVTKKREDVSIEMYQPKFWFSKRFVVAILTFIGQIISVSLITNMNIAIVEMTSKKMTIVDNQTIIQEPDFEWNSRTKGLILGATSYGGLLSFLGGYLAWKFGGSTIITFGALLSSITTLLNPVVVHYSFHLFWILRVLNGVGIVSKFVSISEMWSQWAPLQERTKLIAIGFSGFYAGSVFSYSACGFIIHKLGWPAAFYCTGGIGLIWTLIWYLLVPNDPSSDKWISREELTYIKANQKQTRPKDNIKIWKNIIISKAVLALCLIKFAHNAGYTLAVTYLPMYIKDITNAEIDKVGLISSVPSGVSFITVPLIGYAMDALQNSGLLTITRIHKLFLSTGFVCGSTLLFVTAFYASSFVIAITCLTLFKIMLSLAFVVTVSLPIFLAPRCASMITGVIAVFHHLSGIFIPILFGFILTSHSVMEWSLCLCTTAIILLVGAVLFMIFGSSEPQPWSYAVEDSSNCESTAK